jgi:predicted ATPase
MSIGHGGQVLLTQTTCELVKQYLPDGVSLRDLGEHRLKDLLRPVRVYQLVITGLPVDFPPLKSLNNRPNNLPFQLTQLIGREQDVATALNFLRREEVRLLNLTGPGGIGKTRLALQVAAELGEAFSDGVYFVNLAPLNDPELVIPTIAQTLDIQEIADQTLLNLLKASLHWKHILLLLDNFEQVVGAAAYVAELLVTCPMLKVLVTSRAALHVRGEQEFAVPPLAVPDPKHLPDLVTLSQYEAVALFIQRAQAVKPEFHMTNANAPAVAEICVRLDGQPLAIELAAARIKVLPPQALLARLGQRLAVLTSGARDAPARQQTLRNTISWSYDLLNAEEQRLFRRLSAFSGGCTLHAIEALYTRLDKSNAAGWVFDGGASLIDKSLLQQREQEGKEPRLVMLETIREYGLEALMASEEMEITRQAHTLYYLQLAEEAEPELAGPQQSMWIEWLEQDHNNLRAAMHWSLEQARGDEEVYRNETALRLGSALRRFWMMNGHISEGRSFLEQALKARRVLVAPLRAKALLAAASLAVYVDDYDEAESLCEESLALCRELEDKEGIAFSLYLVGPAASTRGNPALARMRTEEALALFKEVSDKDGIAWSLNNLAWFVSEQGEYARAQALFKESWVMHEASENKRGIAWAVFHLAWVLFVSQDDPATARSLLEEGLTLLRELGDKGGMAQCLSFSGQLALSQGDEALARSFIEESMVHSREMGSQWGIAMSSTGGSWSG